MSKFKMNCGYCGKKCNMETDFCIPQDSVYICKKCYEWQDKVSKLEDKLAESEKNVEFYKERYSDATTSAYGADLMAKDYQWHLEKEIAELKQQLALTEKALELACEEMIEDLQFDSEDDRHYTLQENIEYFKTMAKKGDKR